VTHLEHSEWRKSVWQVKRNERLCRRLYVSAIAMTICEEEDNHPTRPLTLSKLVLHSKQVHPQPTLHSFSSWLLSWLAECANVKLRGRLNHDSIRIVDNSRCRNSFINSNRNTIRHAGMHFASQVV